MRVRNDIWALGKMIMEMGDTALNDFEKQQLKRIAQDATADEPTLRPTVHEIISFLSNRGYLYINVVRIKATIRAVAYMILLAGVVWRLGWYILPGPSRRIPGFLSHPER